MMVTPDAVCSTVGRSYSGGRCGWPAKGAATTITLGSAAAPPSPNPPPSPRATGAPKPPPNVPAPQPPAHVPKGKGWAMNGLARVKVGEKELVEKKNGFCPNKAT